MNYIINVSVSEYHPLIKRLINSFHDLNQLRIQQIVSHFGFLCFGAFNYINFQLVKHIDYTTTAVGTHHDLDQLVGHRK